MFHYLYVCRPVRCLERGGVRLVSAFAPGRDMMLTRARAHTHHTRVPHTDNHLAHCTLQALWMRLKGRNRATSQCVSSRTANAVMMISLMMMMRPPPHLRPDTPKKQREYSIRVDYICQ